LVYFISTSASLGDLSSEFSSGLFLAGIIKALLEYAAFFFGI
jgi:hypothetical protein